MPLTFGGIISLGNFLIKLPVRVYIQIFAVSGKDRIFTGVTTLLKLFPTCDNMPFGYQYLYLLVFNLLC